MTRFLVRIFDDQQMKRRLVFDESVVIGRQQKDGPPPFESWDQDGEPGLVIADHIEKGVPRRWFRISCDEDGQIVIENLHSMITVSIADDDAIPPSETRSFNGEIQIDVVPGRAIHVRSLSADSESESAAYRSLMNSNPSAPGEQSAITNTMTLRQFSQPNGQAVVELLHLALQVVQKASGSDAFFQAAVDATSQIIALDRAIVLLRSADEEEAGRINTDSWVPEDWYPVAERLAPGMTPEQLPPVSTHMLTEVVADGATKLHDPMQLDFSPTESLQDVRCAVASPILDKENRVVGVLYGDRWSERSGFDQIQINDLEATLVEVLAGTVAGGIARVAEERLRGNLADFFSPSVASLLATNPELMKGHDAEVSILFCDIRGFSTVTEQLGPQKTIEWINDVLSELSQCVVDTDGVLVDYVGDELMAMWGAPVEQKDHAGRAVATASAMLESIEVLRKRWSDVLPQRFGAGVGVNTGLARVGNVGSKQKFKYGALGNIVNVASRLQAATKQLGVDCMISGETAAAAGCIEKARRLAKLSVVGIEQPIDVYQIPHKPQSSWSQFREEYELALGDYEEKRFGEATRRLGQLMQTHTGDRPCKLLLSRAVDRLDEPDDGFSPVWVLKKK